MPDIYTKLIELNGTIFVQLINTLIIFAILRYFLFKPVRSFMLSRQAAINDAFENAEMKRVDADALIADYQGKLDGLTAESREIVKTAKQKADAQANDIIEEAREKAAEILRRAEAEAEKEKQKAIHELKDQIAGIAIFAAEKILEKELTQKAHGEMIEKLIQEAGNSQWQS